MKRLLIIALALVLLIVSLVALVTTTTGLRLVARIVMPLAPGQISFGALDGRLIGPLGVTQMQWDSESGQLRIGRLDLDWQPARLASRELQVDRLTATGLRWLAAGPAVDTAATTNGNGALNLPPLPLTINITSATIDDIRIDQGATSLAIDTLQLAGRFDDIGYTLDKLTVRTPVLDLSGAAALAVDKPNKLDAELSWLVRLADSDTPIAGTAIAHGDLDKLAFALKTENAFHLDLSGSATTLINAPQLEGRLEIDHFDPAIAGLEISNGELTATLDYRLGRDGFTLDGRILAPGLWPAAAIISTDAQLSDNSLTLNRLNLKFEDWPTVIDVAGTLRTDLSDLNLQLRWTEFVWPPGQAAAQFASPGGNATLTGSRQRYGLQLSGTTAGGALPAANVSLRGQGGVSQFAITEMSARFAEGSVSGKGLLDWAATPQARLDIVSQDLQLSQWHQQLDGRLGFDGTVVASLPADGVRASVKLRTVNGQLRGFPLSGSGAVDFAAGKLAIDNFKLAAGPARIEANGHIGNELDLDWNVDIPDIALFIPGGAGLLRSHGKASGLRNQPGLVGELTIENLAVGEFKVASIDGHFSVGTAANSLTEVSVDGSGIKMGSVSIDTITGGANGTVAQHAIEVEVDGPVLKLATRLDGGIVAGVWNGVISSLTTSRSDIGVWSLVDPTPVSIETERIALTEGCLAQRDARLCIGGNLARSEPWRIDFVLTALPVEAFSAVLPPGLVYEGEIDGDGHIASSDSGWAGMLKVLLAEGRIVTRQDSEEDVLIAYQNGTIDADFNAARIQARVKVDLRDAGSIDANIIAPTDSAQPLQGTVYARVENLSLVPALVPQIGRIDGRIDANLVLAGTTESPDLSGQVGLQASELVLPDLGITLHDASVTVITQGADLRFDGSASSGSGRVSLNGELRWNQGRPKGQLALQGEQFRAIDLPEIWLDMSPAITLTVDGREIGFGGSIVVPAARITPIDLSTGVPVSPDQVIVGQTVSSDSATPWQLSGSVQVNSGENVSIKGYGLEGNLTGEVLVIDAPNQPTTGRGALAIRDGLYRAYGQELAIETGRLEFTGGQIDDPGLNLRAARTTGDVTAGVQVRGALRRPVLTLYSVPAMSETQTLSYLITGRGLEDLSEIDQTAVNDAAMRLAFRGGSLLATSLGREIGLDSVGFEDSGETASTTLVVGKHLTPRLFVSYGIGLFEAINTLRLRYRINSKLTLETQSGVRTSADLLYSIER